MPIVLATDADLPGAPWPFFIMPFIAAPGLDKLCREHDPLAPLGCRSAGAFLAGLHRQPLSLLDGMEVQHYPLLTRLDFNDQRWAPIRGAGVEVRRLAAVQDRLSAAIGRPERHLVHDSLVAPQVLVGEQGVLAVLDWETIRPGFALRDLAVLAASLKLWSEPSPEHLAALLTGYATADPPVPLDRKEFEAWQVYQLLDWACFYFQWSRPEEAHRAIAVALTGL